MTANHTAADDDGAPTRAFLENFGDAMHAAGMPRMAGRAFGALLSTERGSASAGELGDLLSASPAAVSVAVNYLIQVGMVSRSRELGQRRDRYTVDDDVWMNLISGRAQELNRWVAALDEGVKAVGPETSAGRRLRRTQSLLEFLAGEIPGMVARWRELEGNSSSEAEAQR